MITKIEKTRELGVLSGRKQKQISDETVEEVVVAMVGRVFHSPYSSTSVQVVYIP